MTLRLLTLAFAMAAAAAAVPAQAVEFTITRGGELELCRALEANLKAFPKLQAQPFDMPFDPTLTDLEPVVWESLEPLAHIAKLRQHVIDREDHAGEKSFAEHQVTWSSARPDLMEKARAGELALERAAFDANQDGDVEIVYRFGMDRWPATYDPQGWVYIWNLFVLADDDPEAKRHWARYSDWPLAAFYYKDRIFYLDPTGPNVLEPSVIDYNDSFMLSYVCMFDALPE